MKIVFDLDYTLLDTVKFKEALVAATGVDEKKYNSAYNDVVAHNNGLFDPDKLFEELLARELMGDEMSLAEARRQFDFVLTTTDQYLYDGAKDLLIALGKHDASIDLMTFGNAKWQQAKVNHSGLASLFDEVITTEKEKREVVRKLGEGEDKVIIVNDNGQEMQDMSAAAPEYTYILKRGPKAVPKDLQMPMVETIDELTLLLEKETGWELGREMREAKEGMNEAKERDVRSSGIYEVRKDDDSSNEPSAEHQAPGMCR